MELTSKKLWNRDFSLLVIGQLISIFGNQVLNFALPLYILEVSDSPALFGIVLGVSFLPLVITAPLGGVIADRLKKQRIMFWLDLAVTVMIVLYMVFSGMFGVIVPIVMIKLLALNSIQGIYMPAVQASVPILVPEAQLTRANSVTTAVNTLSNIAAPAVAAILLAQFGLLPILLVCAACFAITSVLDLLLRIPYNKPENGGSIGNIVKNDLGQAFRFTTIEKPILTKIIGIMILGSVVGGAISVVGVPVFITQHLGMGMEYVGISRAIGWGGAFFATLISSYLGEKLSIRTYAFFGILTVLVLIPISMVLLFSPPVYMAFVIIVIFDTLCGFMAFMYTITGISYVMKITPPELIGKVMSVIVAIPLLATGSGVILWGILFERFYELTWLIVFVAALISGVLILAMGRHFKKANADEIEIATDT